MDLLLLGLAILLTTSSSLLAASSSEGEDKGREISRSVSENTAGEISGSVSVTASGELWLTVFIDELLILVKIEVVSNSKKSMSYRFFISAISALKGTLNQALPHVLPLVAKNNRTIECSTQNDAVHKLMQLFDEMGIAISQESMKSIPYAISCGWKTPEECHKFIEALLKDANENEP